MQIKDRYLTLFNLIFIPPNDLWNLTYLFCGTSPTDAIKSGEGIFAVRKI
jgi:hypothetical protein